MTIKDFARLCNCNPQTLRYYDHMNLLKPVKVDKYSGYRFYDEEQAINFVKIKNLQSGGFTIGEIKELLDKDNDEIYEAFNKKIAEQEEKLQRIKLIQRSYQNEMSQMKQKIQEVRERVSHAMLEYDPKEEFGIDEACYTGIIRNVSDCFETLLKTASGSGLEFLEYPEGYASEEETEYLDLLNNPDYEVAYERHQWNYVKDFLGEFSDLEDGEEYALYFEVTEDKTNSMAFANTILGILLEKNPGKRKKIGCSMTLSKDGKNHFWLLRLKH